jgi:hypothetical protein
MKLKKLLPEGVIGRKAITTKTGTDPETGAVTWKVNYVPDFTGVIKSLNRVIRDLDEAMKTNNLSDDPSLKKHSNDLKYIKYSLLKKLKKDHPDKIEKLSKR